MSSSVSSIHETSQSSASFSPLCNKGCDKFEYNRKKYYMLDIFLQKLTSPRPVSCLQHPPTQTLLRTPHGRVLRLCLSQSLCVHVSASSMACLCFCLQIRSTWMQAKIQQQDGAWREPGGFESFIQYHMFQQKISLPLAEKRLLILSRATTFMTPGVYFRNGHVYGTATAT